MKSGESVAKHSRNSPRPEELRISRATGDYSNMLLVGCSGHPCYSRRRSPSELIVQLNITRRFWADMSLNLVLGGRRFKDVSDYGVIRENSLPPLLRNVDIFTRIKLSLLLGMNLKRVHQHILRSLFQSLRYLSLDNLSLTMLVKWFYHNFWYTSLKQRFVPAQDYWHPQLLGICLARLSNMSRPLISAYWNIPMTISRKY